MDLSESFMRLIGHCRNDLEEVIHVKCREDFDISKLSSLDRGRLYRSSFSSNSFLFEEIDDKTDGFKQRNGESVRTSNGDGSVLDLFN